VTTFAEITGKVTVPGSDVGLPLRIEAHPLVKDGVLSLSDRLTYDPVRGETRETDGILGEPMQIPLDEGATGVVWRFDFKEPSTNRLLWSRTYEITGDAALQALEETEPLVVTPDLVESVAAYAEQTAEDRAAVEALGTTTDAIIAGRIEDTDSETSAVLSATTVARVSRSKHAPALGLYFPEAEGAANDGVTDDTAAINAADAAAVAGGGRLHAEGTYKIASTVTVRSAVDMALATLNYTGSGVALQVGDGASLHRKTFRLPSVIEANKPSSGWNAGTVGVQVINCFTCTVYTPPRVFGFETGLNITGQAAGCAYNTFHIGHLDTNKRNLVLDATSTGYCNQNLYLGGRFSHSSSEGTTAVSGARHIYFTPGTHPINNNLFLNPSVEGSVAEYQIDIDGGQYNIFINPRLEGGAGFGTVRFGANADRNTIIGGYQQASAVVTRVTGETYNSLQANNRFEIYGSSADGLLRLRNKSSSSSPSAVIMEAATSVDDIATAWAWRFSASHIKGKRAADASERVTVDPVNGRIYFGNGTGAPTAYVGNLGSSADISIGAGSLCFGTDNSFDIGRTSTFRPRDLFLARNAVVGGALDHDGTTVGFYGTTPAARPAAYTQTYATATRTHSALTSSDAAGATPTKTEFDALRADLVNTKQLLNSLLDDLQTLGLLQ